MDTVFKKESDNLFHCNVNDASTENKKKPYECDICDARFAKKSYLTRHKRSHALIKPFDCDECDARFARKDTLHDHKLIHSGLKPHECDKCDAKFAQKSKLTRHQLVHSKEKIHECDECDARFARKDTLIDHKLIHSGVKKYECDECNAKFARKNNLVVHQRQHSNQKPYECDKCDAKYADKSGLDYHQYVHTEIRAFECDQCEAKFKQKSHLTAHQNIHSENKLYECDKCDAKFVQKGNLIIHQNVHTGLRPYHCDAPDCNASFAQRSNLNTHKFYWHTTQGQFRKKKDEARILKLLEKHNIPFKEQHLIDFTCMGSDRDGFRCFIDFLIQVYDTNGLLSGFIFLEVDEHQHTFYEISCEIRRMADVHRSLIMEGNTYPITFIRYNPHEYTVNDIKQKVPQKTRQSALVDVIKNWEFTQDFSVKYMYYDSVDDIPSIFNHPDYTNSFKEFYVR